MKTRIIYLFIIFFVCINYGIGQIPLYELKLDNFVPNGDYYTANELTFDITIRSRSNTNFEYAGGLFLINFNTEVANGGDLILSIAGPDTSDLPQNLRPTNPQIIPGSTVSQFTLDMNSFPGAGNGFIIPQDHPVKIIKLKLTTTAATFNMSPGPLGGYWFIYLEPEWRNQPPFINGTKIFAYIIRTSPVNITSNGWHWVNEVGLAVNPVELIGFTSNVTENKVTLSWTTSNEINNSGFDVERSSGNDHWTKSGFVEGSGNTNNLANYTFSERLNSGKYLYRLKQIDYNGNFEYFNLNNEVVIGLPQSSQLLQNYPNPFNPETNISYTITENDFISLKIYDISGKEILSLVNDYQEAGYHMVRFNAADLSGGVYFYKLSSGHFLQTKRMVLLK